MSLIVEYYRTASRFREAGVSTRFLLNDFVIQNRLTPQKYYDIKRSDSIWADKLRKMDEAEQVAFELKIKDSYKKVINEQAGYENVNIRCIHDTSAVIQGSRIVYKSVETISRDPVSGTFVSNWKQKPVTENYDESFSGITNNCSKPVTIYGIVKYKSRAGTVYYTNNSMTLEPGEIAKDIHLSNISTTFNSATAKFGEVYYYLTKLKQQ